MDIIKVGEMLHIIERRYFESDPRRHFIGEVLAVDHDIIRIRGRVWIYDTVKNRFVLKPETRERAMILGERHIVNVLPPGVLIDVLVYETTDAGNLVVTDHKDFSLDINEFGHSR
jgi:hypothetical protein